MRALQWDCMTEAQRWAFVRTYDFGDVEGGPTAWIDRPYPELPTEVRQFLKLVRFRL